MATITTKFTAKTDVTELTSADIAKLVPADLAQLSKIQAALLTSDQIGGFSATTLPSIAGVFKYITTDALAGLNVKAIPGLPVKVITTTQLAGLSVDQVTALSTSQVAQLSKTQLAAFELDSDLVAALNMSTVTAANLGALVDNLSTSQITKLTSVQIGGLSSTQIGSLTVDQAASLTPTEATYFKTLANLPVADISNLDTKLIAAIPSKLFATLSTAQLDALTGDQVGALTSVQISALTGVKLTALGNTSPSDIAAIASSALAGLTKDALSSLNLSTLNGDGQFAGLKAAQIALLSTTAISQITASNAESMTSTQLATLTATQASHLDSTAITSLTPAAFSGLSAKAFAAFTTTSTGSFATQQIQAITGTQAATLTSAHIKGLSENQVSSFTADAILSLTPAAIKAIPAAAFDNITSTVFSQLTLAQIAAITPAQFAVMTANQLSQIASDQAAAITSAQIKMLTGADFASLTSDAVLSLQPATLKAITPEAFDNIAEGAFSLFTSAQIAAFTPAQSAVIVAGQIARLGPDQTAAFTTAQFAKIPAKIITSLPIDSFAVLSPAVIKGLNVSNFSASQLANLTAEQSAGLSAKQLTALADKLSGLSSDALATLAPNLFKGITVSGIAALTNDAVSAINPAQLAVLTTTQLEAFKATQAQYFNEASTAWLLGKGYNIITESNGSDLGVKTTNTVAALTNTSTITAGKNSANITGSGSADTIIGNVGNDTIAGGTGLDSIDAGAGNDIITYSDVEDTIDGGLGKDTLKIVTTAVTTVSGITDANLTNVETVTISGLDTANVSFVLQTEDLVITAEGHASRHTIVGGLGNDTITGGTSSDTLTGGKGVDVLTGGANGDRFVFAAGDNGEAPSATVFDTITDYATGDIIDFGTTLSIQPVTSTAAGIANISSLGLATFNSADSSLSNRIEAVEAAMSNGGAPTAGEAAVFIAGTDSYVFISDSLAGVGANDVLVKLKGLTSTSVLPIDVSGDMVTPYTAAQFVANIANIDSGDSVYIVDTTTNIAAAVTTLAANNTKIDKIIATDTANVSAATLNTISGVSIDITAATGITGSTSDLITALVTNAGTIIDSGTEVVTVTGTETVNAADLTAIDLATTGIVTVPSSITVTGTITEDTTFFVSAGKSAVSSPVIITGTAPTVSQANVIDAATSGAVTASLTDTAANLATLTAGSNHYTTHVSTGTVSAANLIAIDNATDIAVDAALVSTITGTETNVMTVSTGATITRPSNWNATVDSGTLTTVNERLLDSRNGTGIVTATISESSAATLANNTTGLTGSTTHALTTLLLGTAAAADLNTINGLTNVIVNATGVTTINGTVQTLKTTLTAVTASEISKATTVAITIDDPAATGSVTVPATDLSTIGNSTTGTVTVTNPIAITGNASEVSDALVDTNKKVVAATATVAISDNNSTVASVLKAIGGATSGTVTASSIPTITGSAQDVTDALVTVVASGTEAITISDGTSVAQANAIDAKTTGAISATISDHAITTLNGLSAASDTLNAYTTSVVGGASISQLAALDGKTSVALTYDSVNDLASTLVMNSGTYVTGNIPVTVTDTGSVTADALNTINGLTNGVVTATAVTTITGSTANVKTALTAASAMTHSAGVAVILDDAQSSTVLATDLKAINDVSGTVTVTNSVNITGGVNDVVGAFSGLSLATGTTVTVTSSETLTPSQANSIALLTTGVVTATVNGAATDFAALTDTSPSTNAYAITVISGDMSVSELGVLKAKTSGTFNYNAVTVTDTPSHLTTDIATNSNAGTYVNGSHNVKVSDLASVADAITIDNITSGTLTFTTGVTGTASAYASTDGTLATNVSNLLGYHPNATVSNAATIAQLAAIKTAITSGGGTGTLTYVGISDTAAHLAGNTGSFVTSGHAITVTDTGSVTASNLTTLDGLTSNSIDAATNPTKYVGSIAELLTLTSATLSTPTITLKTTGTLDASSATTANAGDLNTLHTRYASGLVDATFVASLTGSASDIKTLFTYEGSSAGNVDLNESLVLNVNDITSVLATDLTTLQGKTAGMLNATGVSSLQGSASEITAVSALVGTTGNAINIPSTIGYALTENTSQAATVLSKLNVLTTGTIDAHLIPELTGTLAQIKLVANAQGTTGDAINLKTDIALIASDSASTAATVLSGLNSKTTGLVSAVSVTELTGTVAEIKAVTNASTLSASTGDLIKLGTAVNLNAHSDTGSVLATDLTSLFGKTTTGLVTADAATQLTGSLAEIKAVTDNFGTSLHKINLSTTIGLTATDTASKAATTLTDLATGATQAFAGFTGVVKAESVPEVTGTFAEIKAATDLGASLVLKTGVNFTASDTASTAATALALCDVTTTGTFSAALVTEITGTVDQIKAVTDSSGVTLKADVKLDAHLDASTTLVATKLSSLDSKTTGIVDASGIVELTGTLAEIKAVTDNSALIEASGKVTLKSTVNLVASDAASTAATVLSGLDGKTGGLVSANLVTELTGTLAEIKAVTDVEGTSTNNIDLKAGVNLTVSDTASQLATNLTALHSKTTGNVSVVGVTEITGTVANVKLVTDLEGTGAGSIDLGSAVAINVSADTGSAVAEELSAFDSLTTGLVNASGITELTGIVADIKTVMDHAGTSQLSLKPNVKLTVTADATTPLLASTLNTWNKLTTGTIDISDVGITGTLQGTALEIKTVVAAETVSSNGIKFNNASNVTITGDVTLSDLNTIDSKFGDVASNVIVYNGDSDANSTSGTKLLKIGGTIDIVTGNFLTEILTGSGVTTTGLSVVNATIGDTIRFIIDPTHNVTELDTDINNGVADNKVAFVHGTYSSGSTSFIYAAGGLDALAIADVDSSSGQLYEAIVLVGGGLHFAGTAVSGAFAY